MFIPPLLAYFLMLVGVLALVHIGCGTRPEAAIKWLQESMLLKCACVYLTVGIIAMLWRPDQGKSAEPSTIESDNRQTEFLVIEKPLPSSVLRFEPTGEAKVPFEGGGYDEGYEETFGEMYDLDVPEIYSAPDGGVLMESFGWVA